MAETLNKEVLDPDKMDPTGLHKFFAIALVKVVMYCKDNSEEAAVVMKEVLATIGLHVPYSSDFNQQLHQVSTDTSSMSISCNTLLSESLKKNRRLAHLVEQSRRGSTN
jgi:hypothetical protein